MADSIGLVKAHMTFVNRQIERFKSSGDTEQSELWSKLQSALQSLLDEVVELRDQTRPVPSSYGDVSDLPASLRKQLAGLRTDELEDQIYTIVKASPEGADLDTILIELWRRYNVEQTRRFVQNKAYRMATLKEVIFSVKGKKGFYAATPDDAERLSLSYTDKSTRDNVDVIGDSFSDIDTEEDDSVPF